MRKIMTRFAILILSVFTVSAGATAATIPLIMKSFPNISSTTIELLMTIPSLGIIVFTPVSNWVADLISVKKTIMTGLVLIFFGGVIPAITMNFPLIFVSRIILGLGTGLLMSFSQSLIIQLYQGREQQRMLGLSSVFQGLGMFVMTYAAGVLLNNGWQMSYWVYLIVVPIILLVGVYVPKTVGKVVDKDHPEAASDSKKIDGKIWLLALFAFVFNATFAFISIKFALLVVSRNYGTAADASTLLGLMAFAMAAGGFVFMYVQKHWFKYTTAIGLGFATISFLLLTISHSLILSGLGVILVGISVSIFMASMVANINKMTSASQVAFSTSVVMTCANIGTLLSPYFAKAISNVFGNQEAGFTFEAGLIIFAILFVIATFVGINYSRFEYKESNKLSNNVRTQN
ncbi:MFS transporter [Companilactobacillus alimentarius]|uniref:MFS transporter n=1 Tax=Companilactobacillus alimentarius DSM 20249 TaxID=1423720 RepID=A0A2K9HHE7_9LACO|nr:MFS transporter [Companilactobacillus alimentarius]AUI71117.1 MFS transporter [Companilactobacillus alimentarius DSM 20249]GEO43979.1 MFS transporter [Companilactobacillus alimentarius]